MHRRQKKPYAIIFAVVVALVVIGALRDMDRLKNPPAQEKSIVRFNYADDAGDFARLPRDTSPVMINIGSLTKDDDGSYRIAASDIEPITLPQREVNLLISFDTLPSSVTEFGRLIEAELTLWKRKNNKIVEILLDWQTDTPDLEKIGTFATGLREHLKLDYWIGLGVRRSWFEADPAQLEWPQSRADGIRHYVYTLEEAGHEGESLGQTLGALDDFGLPYVLLVKQLPAAKEARQLREAHDIFQGFVVPR
jgi:hypothetical protein